MAGVLQRLLTDGVQRVMNEGVENQLIAGGELGRVQRQRRLQGRGGLPGPLDQMVLALCGTGQVRSKPSATDMRDHTGIAGYRARAGDGIRHGDAGASRAIAQLRLRSRVGGGAVLPGHGADYRRDHRQAFPAANAAVAERFSADEQRRSWQVAMKAIELLKNDQTRGFRIEISG